MMFGLNGPGPSDPSGDQSHPTDPSHNMNSLPLRLDRPASQSEGQQGNEADQALNINAAAKEGSRAPQEDPGSTAGRGNDPDDARSNASSESDLFVDQDDEIKSESHSDAGTSGNHESQQGQSSNGSLRDEDEERHGSSNGEDEEHHGQTEQPDTVIESDDDDFMEVDANDVPEEAMTRFATFKFGSRPDKSADLICTGSVKIKVEDQDDEVILVPSDSDDEADSDFRADDEEVLSDGERPRKRRRRQAKKKERPAPRPSDPATAGSGLPESANGDWQEPSDEELQQLFTEQERLSTIKAMRPLALGERLALAKISARIAKVEEMAALQPSGPAYYPPELGDGQDEDRVAEEEVDRALANALPPQAQTEAMPAPAEGAEPNPEQPNGNPEGVKARRPTPRNAKEFWEREYAEKGSGVRNMTDDINKKKPLPRKLNKRKKDNKSGSRENKLVRMLQDANPIMARAAQGAIAMPGAIQATRQPDQLKAMKDFLFKISSNPNPRSTPLDLKILKHAVRSFGLRQVRAVNGRWKLRGMATTLFNHQLVGVSRMLCQEFSPDGPYGGILADQMGLGKTVQMLATMSANRPTPEEVQAGRHQTLIVVPAVAINQWVNEIKKHCEKSFIKAVHHYKASAKIEPEVWKTADIVIASYNEVANAYPSDKTLKRIAGMKLDEEEWAEAFEAELGELFGTEFFRVVLDEGHAIRNNNTKTAKACINLTSKYRWILTGTPIHNSIEELYPYFRFLGAHWANDEDEFAKQFGNIGKDDVRERIDHVLASIMIRRRVDDKFLGVPILQIPQTHPPKVVWVGLTTEERLIYRRLETRFRDNMSTHVKEGTARKKLKTFLAFLTRLRQAIAHPYLLEGVLKGSFTLEDFHYLRRQLSAVGGKTPMHAQVQHWVTMEYEGRETTTFGRSRFGYEFDMDSELEQMEASKSLEDVICRYCYDSPVGPVITECGHTFCQECLAGKVKVEPACPTCGAMISLQVEALMESESKAGELDDEENGGKKKRRKRKVDEDDWEIGDDANMAQPKMNDSHKWIDEYDKNYPKKELIASAKTIAVKNQILIWQAAAPEDKIIVFVTWSKLACILGRMLFEEQINFLYYFGDLKKEQKEAAINKFKEDPSVKVLIASTRCGGQALNLTCANRVILVDQWWNTAMETQAFGRVHRIGQEKETHFVKIIVKDSIDERLLEMQQAKQQMIGKALQEDAGHKTAPTLDELVRLFGVDENGGGDKRGGGGEDGVVVLDDDEGEGAGEAETDERMGEAMEAPVEEEIDGM